MNQFLGMFFEILLSISNTPDCTPVYHTTYEYSYELPEGLHELTDWNKKGYFIFEDDFGNGGEIAYFDENIEDLLPRRAEWFGKDPYYVSPFIGDSIKTKYDHGEYPLGVWEVEILVPLGDSTAIIMIAKEGNSQAYRTFEKKALQLARSVVQEESYERYTGNCDHVGHPFWSLFSKKGS